MDWVLGWLLLGGMAFILALVNIICVATGKHCGWQALLFASLSCGGAAMSCALLAVCGYVQGRMWDTMTDVVPTLAKLSSWALCLGIALNLLSLWLHLRTEKMQKEAEMDENARRTALIVAYGMGVLIVAVLTILAVVGPKCVLFPDTMLPMELREVASAWLAIGFLPMLLVSMQVYKTARRKIVLFPAGLCLLAVLFWVGVWTVGMVRSPAMASGGDIALPEEKKIESVHLTGSELDLTVDSGDFIGWLLHGLSQAEDTGRISVQDVPDQGAGLVRVDLNFREGGTSTLFLYRDDSGLMVEQPYQGIYRVDDSLELWLREQIALELTQGVKE